MLAINPVKVRHVIEEARIFDGRDDGRAPGFESGSEDRAVALSDDVNGDGTRDEMVEFIRSLDDEEQTNLVALAWLGRGSFDVAEWEDALLEARRAHNKRTAEYLMSLPKLGDYLEEGLCQLEEAGEVDYEDPEQE